MTAPACPELVCKFIDEARKTFVLQYKMQSKCLAWADMIAKGPYEMWLNDFSDAEFEIARKMPSWDLWKMWAFSSVYTAKDVAAMRVALSLTAEHEVPQLPF